VRVLILFSSGEIGGAERSLTRMVLSSGCNIDYKLATLDGYGPWVEWCIEKDIKPLVFGVAQNGVSHGKIGIRSLLRFIAHVRKKQYDILYVVGLRASIWLRLAKPLFGDVKLVHGIRWNPNSESRLDRAFRLVEHFIGGLIDLYICNSRIARETLVHKVGISSKKIKVIYNGVDKIPVIKEDYADRPMNVVIIGNHNPRKGHLEFLESVALVLEQQPDARFFFYWP